jgi:hypothetical protein
MIDINSLSKEWLAEKRKQYVKDPAIMESMIYALYLLEQLKLTGLDFIFKGGTSLILILQKPQRFSVDIDIILNPKTTNAELEKYLSTIIGTSVFTNIRLDERRSYKDGVPKAHYIFTFQSNVPAKSKDGIVLSNPDREILLDVLFAENHYPVLVERPLKTEWLQSVGETITVKTPDINSITGDKLTAFAPETTGVPYFRESLNGKGENIKAEMFMEIMKHIFDIGCLFDLIDNMGTCKKSYKATALAEIKYRSERKISSVEDVLRDTIAASMIIARKDVQIDEVGREKFNYLSKGINQFGHFVYTGKFRIEEAQIASSKAAYLAAIFLSKNKNEFRKFSDKIPLAEYMITHPEYNFLNRRLKFIGRGEALFYWNEIIKLLY